MSTIAAGGCCHAGERHFSDEDIFGFSPAYEEWRYICNQDSKFDPMSLPAKPKVGCTKDASDCYDADPILKRLSQRPEMYISGGKFPLLDHPGIPGEDLESRQIERSFSAYNFRYLCDDAAKQGFDVVVTFHYSDFSVWQNGHSRLASVCCSGSLIAARSGQVIAPLYLLYGTSSRSVLDKSEAADAHAPSREEVEAQFAEQAAAKLEEVLAKRQAAATQPTTRAGGKWKG